MKYNAIYGQSGGPTSVINASLYGVIIQCQLEKEIGTLFLMHNGIKGLINDDLKDIKDIEENEIELLKNTPSPIIGSIRYKLKPFEDDESDYLKIVNNLKKYQIKYIFLNGGNDSMDTSKKLSEYFKKVNFECYVIGIPKTIDNDLTLTDFTPGFPSAAKFIANCIKDISYDNESYPQGRVNIVEIMGRDTGWLTASSILAEPYGPDLIYVPEISFDENKFLEDVKNIYERKQRCLVAVSEGIKNSSNNFIFEQKKQDVFSHNQLGGVANYLANIVETKLHFPTRAIELSLLQRCFSQLTSLVDVEIAIKCGKKAVEYALQKLNNVMVIINKDFTLSYAELSLIANQTKFLDKKMISKEGNYITPLFKEYALRLIKDENKIPYEKGLSKFADKSKF